MGMRIPTLTVSDSSHSRYRIVERRRAHQDACFRYMENALTGVCIAQDAKILTCNERFTEIFGFSREELNGMEICKLFHPYLREETKNELRVVRSAVPLQSVQEVSGVTKSGRVVSTRRAVNWLQHDDRLTAVYHVIDVTYQKVIENTLRDSERDLRSLSEQVLAAQEIERKRVASELHDGIGQTLTSIKIGLENALNELHDELPLKILSRLTDTVSGIRAAIEEVRRISMDLRPAMLDDLGIEPTIDWLCREFQSTYPSITISKKLALHGVDVGGTLRAVIFRILQEALNNVTKHAKATRIYVSLMSESNCIGLAVEDNGCGFITDMPRETRSGFGLYSMRERASLSGGRLVLDSAAGAGTRVTVTWPCDEASDFASGAHVTHSFAELWLKHRTVEG